MRFLLILLSLVGTATHAHAAPNNQGQVDIDTLDPNNRAYLEKFCSYHPGSGLCNFDAPPPLPKPSFPGTYNGGGTVGGGLSGSGGTPVICLNTTGGRVVNVANSNALQSALSNAQPGDKITLANGNYSGSFNINKSGSTAQAIVILPQQGGVARITGTMSINGHYTQVTGLNFDAGNIVINGSNNRITRNLIHGGVRAAVQIANGGSANRIDFNEIYNMRSYGVQILLNNDSQSQHTSGNRIDHNYIHDFPFVSQQFNGGEAIQIGQQPTSTNWNVSTTVDHNLIDRVNLDNEVMSLKSGGNTVINNTFQNATQWGAVDNRHGSNNKWIGNIIDNVKNGMTIFGDGHQVIGNQISNILDIQGGNVPQAQFATLGRIGVPNWPPASNVLVACNKAPILRIGKCYKGNLPAANIKLDNNTVGRITEEGCGISNMQTSSTVNCSSIEVQRMTIADVGPASKTDDCAGVTPGTGGIGTGIGGGSNTWTQVLSNAGTAGIDSDFALSGPSCASAQTTPQGIHIASCPANTTSNGSAMLWVKGQVSGNVKVEYDYTLNQAAAINGGSVSGLMLAASGEGGLYPQDPGTWGEQGFGAGYNAHLYGMQVNYAYQNDPRGNDAIRVRGLKQSDGQNYLAIGESPAQFAFVIGRVYHITAIKSAGTLVITVLDTTTNASNSFTTTSNYTNNRTAGWIGFREMPGRQSTIANIQVFRQ